MASVIHVTHEAVHQAGRGYRIGAVLQGLIIAPEYAKRIERTILLGPLAESDADLPLGVEGEVVYDSRQVLPALERIDKADGKR